MTCGSTRSTTSGWPSPTTAARRSASTRADNWTTYYNRPTSQFYRVTTDNHFPFRIYGAQQDNSTVRINNRLALLMADQQCGDHRPTDQAEIVYQAVSAELQIELDALDALLEDMLNDINALVLGQGMQIFSERLGRRGKP